MPMSHQLDRQETFTAERSEGICVVGEDLYGSYNMRVR